MIGIGLGLYISMGDTTLFTAPTSSDQVRPWLVVIDNSSVQVSTTQHKMAAEAPNLPKETEQPEHAEALVK